MDKSKTRLVREIMGATNPADAAAGTLRSDYAASIDENAVHGSDAPESAAREIAYFFSEEEICPRTREDYVSRNKRGYSASFFFALKKRKCAFYVLCVFLMQVS